MPEGPEIRRAADRVARVLEGETVADAWFGLPRLKRSRKALLGSVVTRIDTHGKAMLTRFDNGLTLYSHNQLYGRWYTSRRDREPDTNRDLRVALHTASHSAWLYSASDIELLDEGAVASHPFLSRLGPDILDGNLTAAGVAERLDDDAFRRRSLGALFLDQGFLAGNGNYLRSEILFRARLHPRLRPADLDGSARRRLARETLALAKRSYRTGGVTLPPARAAKLKAAGQRYGQYRFWVFGREGQDCRECGTTIERHEIGSRGLFLCPECQPA